MFNQFFQNLVSLLANDPETSGQKSMFTKAEYRDIKKALAGKKQFLIYDDSLQMSFPITRVAVGKDDNHFFFCIDSEGYLDQYFEDSEIDEEVEDGESPSGSVFIPSSSSDYTPGNSKTVWSRQNTKADEFAKNKAGKTITTAGGFLVEDETTEEVAEEVTEEVAEETSEVKETKISDIQLRSKNSSELIPFYASHDEWEKDIPSYYDPDTQEIYNNDEVVEIDAQYDSDKLIEEWYNGTIELGSPESKISLSDEANDPFHYSENPSSEEYELADYTMDPDALDEENWKATYPGPRLDPQSGMYVPARYLPQGNNIGYSQHKSKYQNQYTNPKYTGYTSTYIPKSREVLADNGMRLDIVNVRKDGIVVPAVKKHKEELASLLDNMTPDE